MDGIRLRIQRRLDNLTALKKRVNNQWQLIKVYLLIERPKQLQKLYQSRMQGVRELFFKFFDKTHKILEQRLIVAKENANKFSLFLFQHLERRWNVLQPRLDSLVQTSFAISTATSTLQLTVQITPILLSALPVLAALPMLNALLPDFLFNKTVLFFIMMGISAYAGYSKFKELETRAKLDGQIEVTQQLNKAQQRQITKLQQRLSELERVIKPAQENPQTPLLTIAPTPLRKVLSAPLLTELEERADRERAQLSKSAPPVVGLKL
ncbi:MAG: hypothetical protein AB7I18_03780 [Candidatus Berkiella sp.]